MEEQIILEPSRYMQLGKLNKRSNEVEEVGQDVSMLI